MGYRGFVGGGVVVPEFVPEIALDVGEGPFWST
jgi:hypothetical protein